MFTDLIDAALFEVVPGWIYGVHLFAGILLVLAILVIAFLALVEGKAIVEQAKGERDKVSTAEAANAMKVVGVAGLVLYLIGGYTIVAAVIIVALLVLYVFIRSWQVW